MVYEYQVGDLGMEGCNLSFKESNLNCIHLAAGLQMILH